VTSAGNEPARRVYRGIWAVLAGFFKVPQVPPTLLAIGTDPIESFRPSPGFLSYLRLQFCIVHLPIAVGLFVVWVVALANEPLAGFILAPLFLVGFVVAAGVAFVALHLRYDTTWYVMSGRSIRIRRGIWVIRETTITFENVQNVELKQGPLQRACDIADLIVQTAGGGGAKTEKGGTNPHEGRIEGLRDAKRIRDVIMRKVRSSRRAGLGDETVERAAAAAAGWSPAHVETLRQIRDEITALRGLAGADPPGGGTAPRSGEET
jgi:membrane protein YdbS with pleckstrin-like domain